MEALIAQMTPEEKAGQLSRYFYIQIMPTISAGVIKALEQGGVGSLVLVSSAAETNRSQKIDIDNSRPKIRVWRFRLASMFHLVQLTKSTRVRGMHQGSGSQRLIHQRGGGR